MNIISALIYGAAGMAAGWFVPTIAEKTIKYKFKKNDKILDDDSRYTSILVKLLCMVVSGGLWAFSGAFAAGVLQACVLAVIFLDALVIAVIDIRTHIIPNETVLILAVAGIILRITAFGIISVIPAIISMISVMVVFTTVGSFLGPGTVGAGDVKLVGAIGLVLGWPYILYGLLGMSALMLLWCSIGFAAKKITLKSMLAFGPFLMGGATIAIVASIIKF